MESAASVSGRRTKQNRMCFSSSATHLSSVSGGENPHDPSALFHVPEKPESRHLVGLRGHVHVDKQGGKLAGVAWDKGERGREVNFAGKTTNNKIIMLECGIIVEDQTGKRSLQNTVFAKAGEDNIILWDS